MKRLMLVDGHGELVERKEGRQGGKIGWALLWLLGVPIPVLLFIFVIRGCQ